MGLGAFSGGVFAALRRNRDLKTDMAMHRTERAYSKPIEPGSKRREELEKRHYDTTSVSLLLNQGSERRTVNGDTRSLHELMALDLSDPSNQDALVARYMEVITRLDYSALAKIDLVTFASSENVEQGRLTLIKDIIKAKQAIKEAHMQGADRPQPKDGESNEDFARRMSAFEAGVNDTIRGRETHWKGRWENQFIQNKEQQDKAFLYYRLGQAALAGGFGGIAGFTGGLISQEAFATVGRAAGLHVGQTALEGALGIKPHDVISPTTIEVSPGSTTVISKPDIFQTGGSEKLSDGFSLNVDPTTHNITILDTSNHPISNLPNLKFNPANDTISGTGNTPLPPDVKQALTNAHFTVLNETTNVAPGAITETPINTDTLKQAGTPLEHRQWYSYDLPKSQGNELKLYDSYDASTKVVTLDMSHMHLGYQTGLNPNPIDVQQAIANHETGFAISLPSTYSEPIWIPTDSHGLVQLDPNSMTHILTPEGKDTGLTMHDLYGILINKNAMPNGGTTNFSATEVNHLQSVFNLGDGKGDWGRIEAGRLVQNPNGSYTLQAFATIRGSSMPPTSIPTQTPATVTYSFSIKPPIEPSTTATAAPIFRTITPEVYEAPFVVTPFAPRRPLEEIKEPTREQPTYRYGTPYGSPPDSLPDNATTINPVVESEITRPADKVLGVTPPVTTAIPTTTSATPENPTQDITLYISDERTSPVSNSDKAEAIKRAHEFIESPEVAESAGKGGINQEQANVLFREFLTYLRDNNIVGLERNESTLDPIILSTLTNTLQVYYGNGAHKNVANVLGKFLRETGFNLNTGNIESNSLVLVSLYDYTNGLSLAAPISVNQPVQSSPAQTAAQQPTQAEPASATATKVRQIRDVTSGIGEAFTQGFRNKYWNDYIRPGMETTPVNEDAFTKALVEEARARKITSEAEWQTLYTQASQLFGQGVTAGQLAARLRASKTETLEATMSKPENINTGAETGQNVISYHGDDIAYSSPTEQAIAVFDGVSQGGNGKLAAQAAQREITTSLLNLPDNPSRIQIESALRTGWDNAKKGIASLEAADPNAKGTKTTVSVAKVFEEGGKRFVSILHAGDSRVYAVTSSDIRQLTIDDSQVEEDVALGRITRIQGDEINKALSAANSKSELNPLALSYFMQRNIIRNSLGTDYSNPRIDTFELNSDVQYLLCTSDGVHDNLTTAELLKEITGKTSAQEIAESITQAAQDRATNPNSHTDRSKRDDISAAVIRVNQRKAQTLESAMPTPNHPVIELTTTTNDALLQSLNAELSHQTSTNTTFSIPVSAGKDYLLSVFKGKGRVKSIDSNVDPKIEADNHIRISGLKLKASVAFGITTDITLDLVLSNGPSGLTATLENYSGMGRGDAEKELGAIDAKLKKQLEEAISSNNPSWKPTIISIVGDKIHLDFKKTTS
jgi:serine/threonine protein phosphatase PrpC